MKKLFTLLCALFFTSQVYSASLPENIRPSDLRTYGSEQPTKVYLFSSLTCPHCAVFHKEIMPILLSDYVDQNKIQLIYVEMPYDPYAMTGTMLSRCIKPTEYEKFMQVMFDNQRSWAGSSNAREIMVSYAKLLGMTKEQADSCLADVELRKTILTQRTNLASLYDIKGMPSAVVVKGNDSKLVSGTDKETLFKEIDQRM